MAAENMSTGIYEMFVTKSTQNQRKIYEKFMNCLTLAYAWGKTY
jgi:hypothetical protein